MRCSVIEFNKVQKTPTIMEAELNEVLAAGQFKYATQSENDNGKIVISLFTDGESGKVKAKVFRESFLQRLEEAMNAFLATGVKMKMYTQSSSGNTLVGVMYYE